MITIKQEVTQPSSIGQYKNTGTTTIDVFSTSYKHSLVKDRNKSFKDIISGNEVK